MTSNVRALLWSAAPALLGLVIAPKVAHAAELLQPDAGPPGAAVVVHILSSVGGFTGSETITTDCAEVVVGPSVVSDGDGNPSAPKTTAVLSTVFFIDADAIDADCTVSVNGVALTASGGVDNVFSIVTPLPAPVDGGVGDADGAADGVLTLDSTLRTDGGVLVLEELDVPATVTLMVDTDDPDSATAGNEAYMPLILLVSGDVFIDGELDVSAAAGGRYGTGNAQGGRPGDGGDGGRGGPGGAGGGGGGPNGSTSVTGYAGAGGDGFAGGGSGRGTTANTPNGGDSAFLAGSSITGAHHAFGVGGGAGIGTTGTPNCSSGAGGSGNLWGSGGSATADGFLAGAGGYGGGGGTGT